MVDESGSMGDGLLAGSRAWGAVRAAMLLDRACELAQVPLQIWGFEDGETPRVIRSWSDAAGAAAARRRIAGITGRGGTQLAPILTAALMTLQQRPEQVRWLVLTLDGELADDDALRVRALLPAARRARIQVQPVFLGSDQGAIDTVRDLVGSCLAAPSPADLTRKLRAWIRAAL
jgi:hypothetical protein